MNLPGSTQYGLISEDLEFVLPNSVREFVSPSTYDSLGNVIGAKVNFKAINYISLIPIMIERMKQQDDLIDSLFSLVYSGSRSNNVKTANPQKVILTDIASIILNQNDPNPFTESTDILFTIPETVKNAKMIFTNTLGVVINSVDIKDRGMNEMQIFASDLSSGMYTYTLVCDGKIIDSKKMIKQ